MDRTAVRIWLTLALCAAASCEPRQDEEPAPCEQPFTGSELDGLWQLTATGTRNDCDSARLEGDLTVTTSMPVRVEADAQATRGPAVGPDVALEGDAFVERIERADFFVTAGPEAPDELVVHGGVSGSCFRIHLEETLDDGDRIIYDLDGSITARGAARGEFTGAGPERCRSSGTFTLSID